MSVQRTGPVRLLCFDGGGVRGLSSLFILREFLRRTESGHGGNGAIPLPCDCFDMICGTGTGGLIAIMLGKLRMSVEDAIDEYVDLSETMFTNKKRPWKKARYSAGALEQAINTIIGKRARDLGWPEAATKEGLRLSKEDTGRRVKMKGNDQDHPTCKVFVCALNSWNADDEPIIRTYKGYDEPDFAIWEAMRATTANPLLFKPLIIEQGKFKKEYIGGEVGHNNPISDLLAEAHQEFPGRSVGLILSLGAGQTDVIRLSPAGLIPKLQLQGIVDLLHDTATDCEDTHQMVGQRFLDFPDIYFRFNVDQGMQDIGIEDWTRRDEILAHTGAYMRRSEVGVLINRSVDSFKGKNVPMSINQAAGHRETPLN
ncbi:unnamed protein product [Rhizoctonia solani]|uniref:PNPLA domain-containing protein n=1 Tax=Rhizoctonia solani TaxID=456999 RepID=A0A8H3HMM3_9AGAM|nr:unnamed protein product [Rhizoctonia solani]CAE6521090.1 unnamed protein product [Rhizoctonia solani]